MPHPLQPADRVTVSGDNHWPVKPSWRCALCDEPWPCGPGRAQIIAETGGARVDLALYMAIGMIEAARAEPMIPPADLYRRFLGWVRG